MRLTRGIDATALEHAHSATIVINADHAARILVNHQRLDTGACSCSWSVWGASFAGHQAAMLAAASRTR